VLPFVIFCNVKKAFSKIDPKMANVEMQTKIFLPCYTIGSVVTRGLYARSPQSVRRKISTVKNCQFQNFNFEFSKSVRTFFEFSNLKNVGPMTSNCSQKIKSLTHLVTKIFKFFDFGWFFIILIDPHVWS
jgi:hypothetical protein